MSSKPDISKPTLPSSPKLVGPFNVTSNDFVGAPADFSIGVENGALTIQHPLAVSDDNGRNEEALVRVRFLKGSIEVQITVVNPADTIGAIFTEIGNGQYTRKETGDTKYAPGMDRMGPAVFLNGIYPDVIKAALTAVKLLKPEEARSLTNGQQEIVRSSGQLLARLEAPGQGA